jgi:HD superfamily phosphodiesterase
MCRLCAALHDIWNVATENVSQPHRLVGYAIGLHFLA